MILFDLLIDLVAAVLDPFRGSDREHSTLFWFWMVVLLAVGAGAIVWALRT